jgi:hypothetical protein
VREWWKVDRRVLFDKKRIKLKRTFGDKSALEYASAWNDSKSASKLGSASGTGPAVTSSAGSGDSEPIGLSESMRFSKVKLVQRQGKFDGEKRRKKREPNRRGIGRRMRRRSRRRMRRRGG